MFCDMLKTSLKFNPPFLTQVGFWHQNYLFRCWGLGLGAWVSIWDGVGVDAAADNSSGLHKRNFNCSGNMIVKS